MTIIQSLLDFATRRQIVKQSTGPRERMNMCVLVGNSYEIMDFDRELALTAAIGDYTEIFGGGRAVRIADDGWVQWRFEPEPVVEEAPECLPS